MSTDLLNPSPLFHEIKTLIDSARQRATVAVNIELTLLYWRVGQRIHAKVLIVSTLRRQLSLVRFCTQCLQNCAWWTNAGTTH